MSEIERIATDTTARLGAVVGGFVRSQGADHLTDGDLLAAMRSLAEAARVIEAGLVELAGQVKKRGNLAGHVVPRDAALHVRQGCASDTELVERVTRVSRRTANAYLKAGALVRRHRHVSSGEVGVARFPALTDALAEGQTGLEGFLAATGPLVGAAGRAEKQHLDTVDHVLAARARGLDPDTTEPGLPAPPAAGMADEARVWAMAIDPDGAEPRDRAAARKRGITLGTERDGLVSIRGQLLVEVAALLQTTFDAQLNPRTGGPRFWPTSTPEPGATQPENAPAGTDGADAGEPGAWCVNPNGHGACPPEAGCVPGRDDDRTAAQKRHDAFATMVQIAAATGELPSIGGHAPTLTVTVTADELAAGKGWARAEGTDAPVSIDVAQRAGCAGVIRRVALAGNGRIVELGTTDRVFNAHQRRAIIARDGGCIIPGCHVPAAWCEIHHVTEWHDDGPTSTDNGVALCWHHHRTIGQNGWHIVMRDGVPYVRGDHWWDRTRTWRRAGRASNRHHEHRTPAGTPANTASRFADAQTGPPPHASGRDESGQDTSGQLEPDPPPMPDGAWVVWHDVAGAGDLAG